MRSSPWRSAGALFVIEPCRPDVSGVPPLPSAVAGFMGSHAFSTDAVYNPGTAPSRRPLRGRAGPALRDRRGAEPAAQVPHRDPLANAPGRARCDLAGTRRRLLAGAAAARDQLWRDRPADARLARPAALRQPPRPRALPELHQRGQMPAAPRDAAGSRRDGADPRRSHPRRRGRGRGAGPGVIARRFAVVGAGASGTVQALHLLREGAERVVLVEREREPGRGTAYGTRRPEHLLNVTAHRMSVWPDDPEEFGRWFGARGGAADDYAPRMQFGDYLSGLMAAAGDRLELVCGEAVAVEAADGGERVRLGDGRGLDADAVVLALGNLRPAPVRGVDPARLGALYVADPWYGGFAEGLDEDDTILLVGTALTAIDAALTLDATGFRGKILAVSRRGLTPRPHLRREPV